MKALTKERTLQILHRLMIIDEWIKERKVQLESLRENGNAPTDILDLLEQLDTMRSLTDQFSEYVSDPTTASEPESDTSDESRPRRAALPVEKAIIALYQERWPDIFSREDIDRKLDELQEYADQGISV